jgi:hypothetical protein
MNVTIYEVPGSALEPLDCLRLQSEFYSGAFTNRERIERLMGRKARVLSRPRPAALSGETVTTERAAGLFFPATLVLRTPIPVEGPEEVGVAEDRIVFLRLGAERAARFDPARPETAAEGLPRRPMTAVFIDRPWDIVRHFATFLRDDVEILSRAPRPPHSLSPSAVVDDSNGPVYIGEGAVIEPFAYIVGPACIGRNAVIKAHAAIRESVIGEGCRVGGEVSCSVLFPWSNKQHAGFLGHSVVGSWVNIGAGATGSNLKNTYGEIRVAGKPTGLQYLGQIIGDHAKIGIQAVMNTGSVYGIAVNLFAGPPLPKLVSSFSFGDAPAEIEPVIRTARMVMERRQKELSPEMERLMRAWHATMEG